MRNPLSLKSQKNWQISILLYARLYEVVHGFILIRVRYISVWAPPMLCHEGLETDGRRTADKPDRASSTEFNRVLPQHMYFYIWFLHLCGLPVRKVWLSSMNKLEDSRESPRDDQERLVSVKASNIDCLVCCVEFADEFWRHEKRFCTPMGLCSGM